MALPRRIRFQQHGAICRVLLATWLNTIWIAMFPPAEIRSAEYNRYGRRALRLWRLGPEATALLSVVGSVWPRVAKHSSPELSVDTPADATA